MSVDFIDSNVFFYLVDEASPAKHATARTLVGDALSRDSGGVSFQVLQETLHVLTRKLKVIANADDAADSMRHTLQPMWRVQPSPDLYADAMQIQQRQGLTFYDSLIVAAALQAGCTRLLSEELQHGQRIGKLRIENPFRA